MRQDRPTRIQRRRTKGWKLPPNTVIVDRTTIWGNPWRENSSRAFLWPNGARPGFKSQHEIPGGALSGHQCVMFFAAAIKDRPIVNTTAMLPYWDSLTPDQRYDLWRDIGARLSTIQARLPELRGKNLACFCRLDQPCHADILLEIANE